MDIVKLEDKFYLIDYFINLKFRQLDLERMNRGGYSDAVLNDSFQHYNLNNAGLEEAEQNYFMKYATSGFSEVNNTQKISKKVETKTISPQTGAFSKIKNTQNEVLRQLRQQYEILRNLPIDEKFGINPKTKQRQPTSEYSSSIDERSDITSSKHSRTKKVSRDAEILSIEKKQLEIVISNSLRKIEQLLQNQMQHKKTIHELKLQIEGKGGVNSEYQMQIRALKKTEKQMRETIQTLKTEIQRKNSTIKELGEKNAYLEGQKSHRDQQQKNFYSGQRQIQDLLRKEKDKSMNAQLQVKRIQMEFEIYQKDKTAEINRLTRELQLKLQAPERELETNRRLQEQIQMKDRKIETLVEQVEGLRGQVAKPMSPHPPQDSNKKIMEELVRQMKNKTESDSKDNNQAIVRALIDKLGTRKDDTLKNELSGLRTQLQNLRRNSNASQGQFANSGQQAEFRGRIRELERIVEDEKREKRQMFEEIKSLRTERDELHSEFQTSKRKCRQYKETELRLLSEIQQLGNFRVQLEESKMENYEMKNKLQSILSSNYLHPNVNFKTQDHYDANESGKSDQEVKILRRKVDDLTFTLNKVTEEKIMSESMLREAHNKQILRLNEDIARYRNLLKNNDEENSRIIQQLKNQLQAKNSIIEDLTKRFESLDKRNQQSIQGSKINYESLLKAEVAQNYNELQSMNQKIIELTKTNENFLNQGQYFARIQREVNELRRNSKNQKRTNETVDHLWDIKEAEYGNINQILTSVRN